MTIIFTDSCIGYTDDPAFIKKWDAFESGWVKYGESCDIRNGSYQINTNSKDRYYYKNITEKSKLFVGFSCKHSADVFSIPLSLKYGDTAQVTITFEIDGTINARLGSDSGTVIAGSSAGLALLSKGFQHYEVYVDIHATTGSLHVKVNGGSVLSASSINTENTSSGGVNRVQFAGATYITDFYFDDAQSQGVCKVEGILPTGDGNYSQMTPSAGNNYECVDERTGTYSDSDYVESDTVDEIDTYTFPDLATTSENIKAVAVNIVCRQDDVGVVKIKPLIRISSTDYAGEEFTISSSYSTCQDILELNPADAGSWSVADINGAEFGVKRTL